LLFYTVFARSHRPRWECMREFESLYKFIFLEIGFRK
jgi:hypothetical protein